MEKLRSTKLVWLTQQQATVSRHKNVFTQSQFCEIHSISLFRSYSVFVRQNTNYISTRNIEHFRSNYFEIYTYICIAAAAAAAAAKSLQSCPTLWDPIDGSPAGSPIPGILQARTLEWVAISFSNAWKWKVKVKLLSRLTPSDPMDCSLPGSFVHGIFQARVLEWVATAFSICIASRCLIVLGTNSSNSRYCIS